MTTWSTKPVDVGSSQTPGRQLRFTKLGRIFSVKPCDQQSYHRRRRRDRPPKLGVGRQPTIRCLFPDSDPCLQHDIQALPGVLISKFFTQPAALVNNIQSRACNREALHRIDVGSSSDYTDTSTSFGRQTRVYSPSRAQRQAKASLRMAAPLTYHYQLCGRYTLSDPLGKVGDNSTPLAERILTFPPDHYGRVSGPTAAL